jgi:hypothetical protein
VLKPEIAINLSTKCAYFQDLQLVIPSLCKKATHTHIHTGQYTATSAAASVANKLVAFYNANSVQPSDEFSTVLPLSLPAPAFYGTPLEHLLRLIILEQTSGKILAHN